MSDEPDHNESGASRIPGPSLDEREDALRESEEKFSALYSSMVEGVAIHEVIYDGSGKAIDYVITDVNPAFESITGLGRHETVGRKASEAYGTGDAPYLDVYARVASSGKPESFETYFPPMQKHFSITVFSPARNTFATVFQDITERKQAEAEIESLARFPAENPNPTLRLGSDGVLLYANQASETLLREWGSAVGGMAPTALRALAEEALGNQKPMTALIEQGERVWSFSVAPIAESGYANLYGRDITVRRRAEAALRQSEERFKLIATNTPDHILVQDKDLRYTWVLNPQLGLTLDDMIGKTDFDILAKEDATNITTIKRRVIETGSPEYVSTNLVSGHGGTEYFEGSYVPTHDAAGEVNGLIGYFRNVTERKRAEEELRLQANALQAAANGIVITDREGTIQWANEAFTRLTGYSAAEAIGQNPRVLKSGRHDATFYGKLWKTILSGRVWQGEVVNKRKDGSFYTEEMTITPVLDAAGAITDFIAIKQDITERKRLEAELDRTRSEFLGEVGHELKTPLTAIKGCASIALSAPIPPDAAETRELFDIIDAQANRLTDLVANLLDVTRIEAGRLSMEPGPADLAKIVEEARVIFEHSQYPHSLEVMLPPRLPALRADGRRIVQVLSNLFTNAAKYSAPTAPIILTAESGKREVTVHVRDAGVGIPSDKMPLLFQKFVQVQERGAKGTGLGLFICKGIVEAHGGRIWAESAGRGKGTVFSFTLPTMTSKPKTEREELRR